MDEYIKRESFMKRLCERCNEEMSESPCEPSDCFAREVIKTFPAADVAPVRHGRWVDRIVDENEVIQPWMKRYYCSECLEGGNQSWFKFCPNCGAKMDGGDGNSDMA